ncbi:MAG: hypothetical protein OXG13_18885 [Gemmatimonadaceae bacterium]|nr:hypothetical protein [Gemmatimonadaceae bacterium]
MRGILDNLFDFGRTRDETPGEALHFRIWELFIGFQAARYAWVWGWESLRITDVVLPLGIARYIDIGRLIGGPLPLVNAGLLTALVVLGFLRIGSRWPYAAAMALLHLQYATRFCLGEIPHSSNLVGMGLLSLAVGGACFRDAAAQRRFVWGSVWFFTGLGYASAGVCKLAATGPGWIDGRHLWLWMAEKASDTISKTGGFEPNLLQSLAADHWIAATAILAVGLGTELIGVLLWWRRTRPWTTAALIAMHFGIGWTMNIFFTVFMAELVIIGFAWGGWLDRLRAGRLPEALLRLRGAF